MSRKNQRKAEAINIFQTTLYALLFIDDELHLFV